MNLSNFSHAALALALMVLIGWPTGNWWAGAAFGAALFVGREHTQAEYRFIEANGGERYKAPQPTELLCLQTRYWSRDSLLDVVLPVVAVLVVASAIAIF